MSISNVRNYTKKVSTIWLPKHEKNKDNNKRHTKVDDEMRTRPQPYAMDYRRIMNIDNGKCTA